MFGWGSRGGGGGSSALSFADIMQRSVAWYDTYFTGDSMFQEAAASTPADDPSEPIGAWLDTLGRDVAATTDTAELRPLLGRSVKGGQTNFILNSDNLGGATWTNSGTIGITDDATVTPNGYTGWRLDSGSAGAKALRVAYTAVGAAPFTVSFVVKQGSGATHANKYGFRNNTAGTDVTYFSINFTTGAITYSAGVEQSGVTATSLGDGWWLVSKTYTSGISASDVIWIYCGFTTASEGAGEVSYFGELRGNQGSTALPHQIIGATARDVSAIGEEELWYAQFDLSDDALVATVPDLGSDATVVYADGDGVTFLEGQTIATSFALPASAKLFWAALFRDPLTTAEMNILQSFGQSRTDAL